MPPKVSSQLSVGLMLVIVQSDSHVGSSCVHVRGQPTVCVDDEQPAYHGGPLVVGIGEDEIDKSQQGGLLVLQEVCRGRAQGERKCVSCCVVPLCVRVCVL